MKPWIIAFALAACAADEPAPTDTATQPLNGSCDVYSRGVLVLDNGYLTNNGKTCCRRAVSDPNEPWCYSCTDPRYSCIPF